MTRPITARQAEVLAFIKDHVRDHHQAPTVREIAHAFGFKFQAAIGVLDALEKKGRIQRVSGVARGIIVSDDESD